MNQIMIIQPYRKFNTWVFDDPSVGLHAEPFVCNIPQMIDYLVSKYKTINPDEGFKMTFSSSPFPGCQSVVTHVSEEHGGNWYYMLELDITGWLCPALFKYFNETPERIYVKVENL